MRDATKGYSGRRVILPISRGSKMVGVSFNGQGQPDISVQKIAGAWQGLPPLETGPAVLESGRGPRTWRAA